MTTGTTPSALGSLHHKIVLDQPQKIHYGHEDEVVGGVVLKYLPLVRGYSSLNVELFGPLHMQVSLKGTARIYHHNETRTEITHLFTETFRLHQGSFRAAPDTEHIFPFRIKFPSHTQPTYDSAVSATQDENGRWNFRETLSSVEPDPLPPSLVSPSHNLTTHTIYQPSRRETVTIEYTATVQIRMPGIDIELKPNNPDRRVTVYYDQPRVPMMLAAANLAGTNDFSRTFPISPNITSHEKPSGLRSKTRAFLNPSAEPPQHALTVTYTGIPQHAFVGQPLSFQIKVDPQDPDAAAASLPPIILDRCVISLFAYTTGVQPTIIDLLRTKTFEFSDFSRIFSNDHGWTRDIHIGVLGSVPSTFKFGKDAGIERTYKLRLACQLSAGKQKLHMRQDVAVAIHPPLLLDDVRGPDVGVSVLEWDAADPPAYDDDDYDIEDALVPSYEQAIAQPAHLPTAL
jgi:hypothetical protein